MTRLLLTVRSPFRQKDSNRCFAKPGVRIAASMQYISRVKRGTGAPDAGPRTAGSWSGADLCRLERDAARDESKIVLWVNSISIEMACQGHGG